jgi:hypothetical protein
VLTSKNLLKHSESVYGFCVLPKNKKANRSYMDPAIRESLRGLDSKVPKSVKDILKD